MKIGLGIGLNIKKGAGESIPAAPVNIIQPFLVGNGAVGEAVICNKGTWSGSPTPTYTYDFRLDSVSVQNGSSNSYTPLLADDGKTLTCLVTATNSQGSASEGTSNSIVIGIAPSNTIAPTLSPSGTQSTSTVITVGNGTFSGTAPLTYAYRWKRNGSIILGETTNTYTLVAGDDGTVITAEVKATNAYGESGYIGTSNQVEAVNAVAPSNVTAPIISGSTSLGSVLSTTNGTWSGMPTTFSYTYQWKRNGSPIGGATASTYTTVVADSLANITCDVTADNGVAPTATEGSNTLTMANYTPANTVAPSISGNQWQGQVLTTTNGTWTNSPTTFTYQWRRGGVDIGGATASTYTLVAADRGTNITCVVTASNGLSASATSNTLAILNTIVQESGSAAAGAYDINLLTNSTYTSSTTQIVRIRRSGDNAEADYGVAASGEVNWTAITSWVVAGGGTQNGFVVTIYDQSGNGRNFTQSTPSAQMQIISSGVLLTDTGVGSGAVARPAMRASGSQFYEIPTSTAMFNFLHNGGDGWVLGVQRFGGTSDPNAAFVLLGNNGTAGANIGINIFYDDRASVPRNNGLTQSVSRAVSGAANLAANNAADNVITPNQINISNFRFDADNATAANRAIAWINNGSAIQNNTLTNAPVTSNATFNMQWGVTNSIFFLTGSLQRIIIWNANLSTQRTTLTTLTNSYYGAY